MKAATLILFGLLLAGCHGTSAPPATPPPHTAAFPLFQPMTADQARLLARKLANEQAHARYGARPFWNGAPARFEQNQWIWSDFRGCGRGDMQATVRLTPDGAPLSVDVRLWISMPSLN